MYVYLLCAYNVLRDLRIIMTVKEENLYYKYVFIN